MERRARFFERLTRLILSSSAIFCGIDLDNRKETTGRTRDWLRRLINLCYFYCLIRLSLSLWLSYVYDYHLNKYQQQPNSDDHRDAVERARENAKLVGTPYLQFAYLAELGYTVLLLLALGAKVFAQRYFNKHEAFDSPLIRTLLDTQAEEANTERQVEREVIKFMESGRILALIKLEAHAVAQLNAEKLNIPFDQHQDAELSRRQLAATERQLRLMAANGKLWPLNRRPRWLYRIHRIFCLFWFALLTFSSQFVVCLMFGLVLMDTFKDYKLQLGCMDVLLLVEAALTICITFTCVSFYLSVLFINSMDQILLLNKLCRELQRFIRLNWDFFEGKLEGRRQEETLNWRLLLILIHFKLAASQARGARPLQGLLVFVIMLGSAIIPLVVRLHAPHMKSDLLMVAVYASLLIQAWSTLCWAFLCRVNSCSQLLCRHLFESAAHTCQMVMSHNHCYHQHTTAALAKELSDTSKLVEPFTIEFHGIKFIYANLFAYLFWTGLLHLSMVYLNKHRQTDLLALL